jgi:hypothetical protein
MRKPFAFLSAAVAVFGVALAAAAENRVALPADAGDLSGASAVEVRDASGHAVLSGTFGETVESAGERERKAALTGQAGRGEAEVETWTSKDGKDMQELEVDVEGLEPETALTVFVDGRQVASLTTDKGGEGEIELFGPVNR